MFNKMAISALFFGIASTAFSATYNFATFEYPPLVFKNEDSQKLQGLSHELVKTVMEEKLNHNVKITVYPGPRAYAMAKNGMVDGMFTAYKTEERQKFFIFPKLPLVKQQIRFFTASEKGQNFDGDFNNILKLRIGALEGFTYGDRFNKNIDKLDIEKITSLNNNFKKLESGRLDLVISNYLSGLSRLKDLRKRYPKKNIGSIKAISPPVEELDSYLILSKISNEKRKNDELVKLGQDFSRELKKMVSSGIVEKMRKRYLDSM